MTLEIRIILLTDAVESVSNHCVKQLEISLDKTVSEMATETSSSSIDLSDITSDSEDEINWVQISIYRKCLKLRQN